MPHHRLLVHPQTAERLRQLRTDPPHSLLLSGSRGVGLHTIALDMAGRHRIDDITPRDRKGNYSPTAPIAIEQIRELYQRTRGKYTEAHFVIIDDADQMTHAAQNALLKLLEEPASNIHFILTSHTPIQLLPTILSRVMQVEIIPISSMQTTSLIKALGISDHATAAQLQFVATGLPAMITRLVKQPKALDQLRTVMGDARAFLAASPYERLRIAGRHQSTRDEALEFVDAIGQLLAHSLSTRADTSSLALLDRSLDIYEQLLLNRNVKLQLLRLVV